MEKPRGARLLHQLLVLYQRVALQESVNEKLNARSHRCLTISLKPSPKLTEFYCAAAFYETFEFAE